MECRSASNRRADDEPNTSSDCFSPQRSQPRVVLRERYVSKATQLVARKGKLREDQQINTLGLRCTHQQQVLLDIRVHVSRYGDGLCGGKRGHGLSGVEVDIGSTVRHDFRESSVMRWLKKCRIHRCTDPKPIMFAETPSAA